MLLQLVSLLSSALQEGKLGQLLQPLLLSQRLLSAAKYGQVLSAAASLNCTPDSPNLGPKWSCLVDAFVLTLPSASKAVLQEQLKLLQHHPASLPGMTKTKIIGTIDTLKDVVEQQQQAIVKKLR